MKQYKKYIASVIACVICFGMGLSIPFALQKKSDKMEKLETVYSILKDKWYYADKIENVDSLLMEQAIMGMSDLEIDPHTNYFNLEEAQSFSSSLEGSTVGIGFSYYNDANNDFVIKGIFIDSPAEHANLEKGDVIVQVDQMVCSKEESSKVVEYIKSHDGQALTVTYQRDGKEYTTSITPTAYDSTVICEVYDDYGVIVLNSFSETSAQQFDMAMHRLKEKGIKKLILDLRGDTGGYLKSVLDISSCLLEKDSVVFIEKEKDGQINQVSSNKYEQVKMDQIVILQDDHTASAAEVLIGALKDHLGKKVTTVGVQSYGKGTEQVSIPFTDGTSIKYTVAEWTTPKGTCINNEGFMPDVEVNLDEVATVVYSKFKEEDVIECDSVSMNAKALQLYLQFLGYPVNRMDEYFSEASSQSLKQYQSDHDLPVTGSCDYKTWKSITSNVLLQINESHLDAQLDKAIELIR